MIKVGLRSAHVHLHSPSQYFLLLVDFPLFLPALHSHSIVSNWQAVFDCRRISAHQEAKVSLFEAVGDTRSRSFLRTMHNI